MDKLPLSFTFGKIQNKPKKGMWKSSEYAKGLCYIELEVGRKKRNKVASIVEIFAIWPWRNDQH